MRKYPHTKFKDDDGYRAQVRCTSCGTIRSYNSYDEAAEMATIHKRGGCHYLEYGGPHETWRLKLRKFFSREKEIYYTFDEFWIVETYPLHCYDKINRWFNQQIAD